MPNADRRASFDAYPPTAWLIAPRQYLA